MPIGINGSGTITGISVGGLPDGIIVPSELSTGGPSWDSSSNLTVAGNLNATLTGSQGTNGYVRLPNGVYLQWGTAGASTGGITTSFPIAFPTACWGVVCINTNQPNPPAPSASYTRTNFTLTVNAGSPTCSWFAYGN